MSRISTTAVGTISVTTLRDGERTLPPEALKNLSDEDITKINSDIALVAALLIRKLVKIHLKNMMAEDLIIFGHYCGVVLVYFIAI